MVSIFIAKMQNFNSPFVIKNLVSASVYHMLQCHKMIEEPRAVGSF